MIYLKAITTPQTLKFIPRKGKDFDYSDVADKMYITNENTKVTEEITITSYTTGEYYHTIEATFTTLEENQFYKLVIQKGGSNTFLETNLYETLETNSFDSIELDSATLLNTNLRYYGKIFVTSQTPSKFSVNSGNYTSNTTTNSFVIL